MAIKILKNNKSIENFFEYLYIGSGLFLCVSKTIMRKLLLFISFFFCLIIKIEQSNAGALLCQDWLNEEVGGTIPNPCPSGEDCSNPSVESGDSNNVHYQRSDNIGVKGVCRDFFPTWGEREMFYRTSNNPLHISFIVKRQYCWARYILSGNVNCGGPNWGDFSLYDPIGRPTWSAGVAYVSWGNTVTATFTIDKLGPSNKKTIFWGSNYAYIDYEDLKRPDGNDVKNSDNQVMKNPKRMCAYYAPNFIGKIVRGKEVIGCIDVPLMPAPPIYNKIIVPKKTVVVASSTPESSTFIKPAIQLNVMSVTGQPTGSSITLIYDSTLSTQICDSLLGQTFSPIISKGDPTKICAYAGKDTSNIIGCVNRPSPTQDYTLEAQHEFYFDNSCDISGLENPTFHAVRLKMTSQSDPSDVKYYPALGSKPIREYYSCKKTYTPSGSTKKKTTYDAGSDTGDFYEFSFKAIIPEFKEKAIQYKYLESPQITDISAFSNKGNSCDSGCFKEQKPISTDTGQTLDHGQKYYVPAGKRDRTSCKRDYSCIGKQGKTYQCSFGLNDQFSDIDKAYCPGVYIKHSDSTQDKICISFPEHSDILEVNNIPICTDIPLSYAKLTDTNISSMTKYVDFSDDGYDVTKTYSVGTKFPGKCDEKFGLEPENCYSVDGTTCIDLNHIPDLEGYSVEQMTNMKLKLQRISSQFSKINANLPEFSEDLLDSLGITKDAEPKKPNKAKSPKLSKPKTLLTISKEVPYRTLGKNYPIGNIVNGCKFIAGKDGCQVNSDTTKFLGNALFTPGGNLNLGNVVNPPGNNRKAPRKGVPIKGIPIKGICKTGHKKSDSADPVRICSVLLNSANNKIVSKAWSSGEIINGCVK
ncbi:MAG: hypothetical protein ACI8ZF_000920 [Candidatus Midichloriaceae bacterium]|jgi:hypothetical protein